jgi:hypothetical protein
LPRKRNLERHYNALDSNKCDADFPPKSEIHKLKLYFYVGRGCGSPELHSVGPDWFEYNFVDEKSTVNFFNSFISNQNYLDYIS